MSASKHKANRCQCNTLALSALARAGRSSFLMRITWDENKNRANLAKHGIGFNDSMLVFFDEAAHIETNRIVEGEERWIAFGMAGKLPLLAVVHTWKEETGEEVIRIISARKATSMKEKSITLNSTPKITKAQRRRLEAIARMPDSEIDTSEIPEVKDWSRGFRFSQRPRTVTTQIDADILEWLKRQNKDFAKPLNRILRLVMDLTQHVGRRRSAA
jgi:uncharacterized protein